MAARHYGNHGITSMPRRPLTRRYIRQPQLRRVDGVKVVMPIAEFALHADLPCPRQPDYEYLKHA